MNKRYSQTDARRIINDCNQLGILQHIPILIGFPGETPRDIVETLEFIFRFQDKPYCKVLLPCQVVVRPNSPLHDNFEEFGLENNNYYDWQTADKKNTLPIRIARRFVARQAHGNRDLDLTNLVDTEEIRSIDLNEPGVARDLFQILEEAFSRAGKPKNFYFAIRKWSIRSAIISWFRKSQAGPGSSSTAVARHQAEDVGPRGLESLERWLRINKNSEEGRERLYGLILAALRGLKAKVKEDALGDR